jgi:hypothetical protein
MQLRVTNCFFAENDNYLKIFRMRKKTLIVKTFMVSFYRSIINYDNFP